MWGRVRLQKLSTRKPNASGATQSNRNILQQRLRHLNNRTTDPEQLNLSSSLLTDASFLIAGYWQHANGDWRQKHDRQ